MHEYYKLHKYKNHTSIEIVSDLITEIVRPGVRYDSKKLVCRQ